MTSVKTIPMPTDQIQELFLNPNKSYEVDLRNSKLKGESFITYIANMRMKCSLITDNELSSEEKFNILTHFLNFNYFVDCDTLVAASALIMLRSRGVPVENTQTWISLEEMDEYINLNLELISKIGNFYDSLVIAVPAFNINFKKNFLEPAIDSGLVEVIEDTSVVSVNTFGALTVPNFLECFLAYPNESSYVLKYYKYPVERFSYNKKSLSEIFRELKGDSLLLSLTHIIFSEDQLETDVLNKHIETMGV